MQYLKVLWEEPHKLVALAAIACFAVGVFVALFQGGLVAGFLGVGLALFLAAVFLENK